MSNIEGTSNSQVTLNIESLYLSVTSTLSPFSSECCIYKVPNRLRNVNEKAYTPQVVAIGPIHHGNISLRDMEEYKWRYLQHFLETNRLNIRDCIEIVKESEKMIRDFYADSIAYSSESFVMLIMLDAVFIIEIILRFYSKEFDDGNDRMYYKPWIIQQIVPDLQLLENQIPFYIVEKMFVLAKIAGSRSKDLNGISMKRLCEKFFKYNVGFVENNNNNNKVENEDQVKEVKEILHFVDLGRKLYVEEEEVPNKEKATEETVQKRLPRQHPPPRGHVTVRMFSGQRIVSVRNFLPNINVPTIEKDPKGKEGPSLQNINVPTITNLHCSGVKPVSEWKFSPATNEKDPKGKEGPSLQNINVPTITNLHRSGVKLKVGSPKNIFKMKFEKGVLEIPKLSIDDHTENFLRNIIAFEQCHCSKFTVTNYFVVIKRLVGSPQDLELLFENGIIENSLGDRNDVFSFITKLADEVTVDYTDSDFVNLCKELDDYCKVSRHKWKATLFQDHCNTPWTTISVIAASILLILTAIQAVCSILSLK